jgi:glycosyltransferase involved in cell wall biosynthesis
MNPPDLTAESHPPIVIDPANDRVPTSRPLPAADAAADDDSGPSIAVIVPCYNEAAAIADVISGFAAALPTAEIHVFDNNSTDGTADIARAGGATVHFVSPRGKGNVVRRMFADVDADVYVMVDGDATYQADIAPELVARLVDGNRDMVVGQRVTEASDGSDGEEYRSGHVLGNAAFTRLYNLLFQTEFEDVFSGYRVMTRRFVKSFPATTTGFDIETELIVHAAELRVEVDEVATIYRARPEGSDSKLSTYKDGWRIFSSAIRLYKDTAPVRFFGALALLSTVAAWALGIPIISEFIETNRVDRFPTAFLAASLQVIALVLVTAGLVINAVEQVSREQRQLAFLSIPRPKPQRRRLADDAPVTLRD